MTTYKPVIPISGNAGWAFLQRTREAQQAAFDRSAVIQRDTSYFEEKIGTITTAADLVSDRRLLGVALGAFGLDADIDNKFFIQKLLQEGTSNDKAFANKLSDKRYFAMAEAFGFGELKLPDTLRAGFGVEITASYRDRQFAIAVGDQDENMRLALGVERDIADITARVTTEDGLWFSVMANPPLRSVFEKALNLPSSVGTLDVDQQLRLFRDQAARIFDQTSVRAFADPELQDRLIQRFLVRAQLDGGSATTLPGSVALSLLQSSGGAAGLPA